MQNLSDQTGNNEISLRDLFDFFVHNRWIILSMVIAGLLVSALYLASAKKQFVARWQLQLALSDDKAIETPADLIHRLRMPTAYTVDIIRQCEMPENGEFGDNLGGKLHASAIKGIANTIEMKVQASSPAQAKLCAESIVALITNRQQALVEESLAGLNSQLAQYQKTLLAEQQQLEMIRKTELANFAYLAQLDESSRLRDRIDRIQSITMSTQPAKLMAPIYAPSRPVSPRASLALIIGGLAGFLAGILVALLRARWRSPA